jgi:parallel beta-helix repeat protein
MAAVDVDDPNRIPTAIIWGSAVPSSGYLISTTSPDSSANAMGFEFRNLMFDTDNAAGAILGDNLNYSIIDNNFFALGRADAWAIKFVTKDSFVHPGTIHGNDASWNRITNNNSRGGGFLCACGAEGGTTPAYNWNHNNFIIRDNVIFAPTTPVGPGIWLRGAHRSLILGNNVEGKWNPAILLEGSYGNRLDANGGEDGSATGQPGLVFVKLVNSDANTISDMGTSTSAGQILFYLDAASSDNIVIAASLTTTRSLYGPNGFVNQGPNNTIIT